MIFSLKNNVILSNEKNCHGNTRQPKELGGPRFPLEK